MPNESVSCQATNVTATYNEAYMEFGGSNVLCPNLPDVLGASMDPELELCLVGDWFYDDQLQYPDSPNPMQRTGLGLKSSCQGDSGGPLFVLDPPARPHRPGADICHLAPPLHCHAAPVCSTGMLETRNMVLLNVDRTAIFASYTPCPTFRSTPGWTPTWMISSTRLLLTIRPSQKKAARPSLDAGWAHF